MLSSPQGDGECWCVWSEQSIQRLLHREVNHMRTGIGASDRIAGVNLEMRRVQEVARHEAWR